MVGQFVRKCRLPQSRDVTSTSIQNVPYVGCLANRNPGLPSLGRDGNKQAGLDNLLDLLVSQQVKQASQRVTKLPSKQAGKSDLLGLGLDGLGGVGRCFNIPRIKRASWVIIGLQNKIGERYLTCRSQTIRDLDTHPP